MADPRATSTTGAPHRYETVAGFVAALVENGTLRPGMRAPSLRGIAKQHSASMSTALQAYRLLEDRGILEARPKSGFYVARGGPISLQTPGVSRPPETAMKVAVPSGVLELLEHAANPDLVPLGCAIPSAELLAAGQLDRFLARAARLHGARYNIYTEARGDANLRGEICRRALRWGQALAQDDLAITCGCTEALALALGAVTQRGDIVAIESPTYFGLLQIFQSLGLQALELPTDSTDGLEITALENALETKKIKACLLSSSFNNPLGCLMPDRKKHTILKLLSQHSIPLIEDDIYGDIHFLPERPKPFLALAPDADILYCSSFSKTVAPGYRVGWVSTTRHMQKILEGKFARTLCGPALPQAALADFLSSGGYDSHLRRIRRVFSENIDRMIRTIERVFPNGTRVTRPVGGFVLWVELPPPFNTRQLFDNALKRKICIAPGDVFTTTDRYSNCMRLSAGHTWDARIENSLILLGDMIRSTPGQDCA